MTVSGFFDECSRMDWYYEYSDDHSVWRRGDEKFSQLKLLTKTNPIFARIFNDWIAFAFPDGDPAPKPIKEHYL